MNRDQPAESRLTPAPVADRLDSWKEIAAYLKRDERTVRRWEKFGLPVHRHVNNRKAAVYAYRAELDAWWATDRTRAEALAAPAARQPRDVLRLTGVALAALSFVLLGWWTFFGREAQSSPPVVTTVASLVNDVSNLAFSPDGRHLAFSWVGEAATQSDIYVKRDGNSSLARLTTDPADECCPAWSPDGQHVAFVRQSGPEPGIYSVVAAGGAQEKLVSLPADRYFDLVWSADGKELVYAERASQSEPFRIHKFALASREKSPLTTPPAESPGDARFALSPDGRSLALIRQGPPGAIILVMPADGGPAREVLGEHAWIGHLAWTADGRSLIFSSDRGGGSKLWTVPASGGAPKLLSIAGENAWFPVVSSRASRLAFVQERVTANLTEIRLAGPLGPALSSQPLAPSTRMDGGPRFSPDGRRLAFHSDRSGTSQVWVSQDDGSKPIPLTSFQDGHAGWPAWSPDGSQIAFCHKGGLYRMPAQGGSATALVTGQYTQNPLWSRDGRWIYFFGQGATSRGQIWKAPVTGGSPIQLTQDGGLFFAESPDGKSLYFSKTQERGIWRLPVEGGAESLVVDGIEPVYGGNFAVVSDGIYWLNSSGSGGPQITFHSFATRRSQPVAPFPGSPPAWGMGITLSPDRQRLIVTQVKLRGSDIMLAENFR